MASLADGNHQVALLCFKPRMLSFCPHQPGASFVSLPGYNILNPHLGQTQLGGLCYIHQRCIYDAAGTPIGLLVFVTHGQYTTSELTT